MTYFSRYSRPLLLLLTLLTAKTAAQNIQPLSDRIDAIVAHPLVLPVNIENPKSIKSDLRVRLDDGRTVPAEAYFIWASPITTTAGWTRSTPHWNLLTPKQYTKSPPKSPGTWIAMIDLPIDAVGQGIWIDETRYEPNWLPAPMRVILETSSRTNDGFWNPALSQSQQDSPYIQTALDNLRADPFNQWRAKLMSAGFNPESNDNTSPISTDRDLTAIHTELLQSDASLVLDQIANHFSARWQIILGRIWLIDPAVARRLKHQLTRTVQAGNRVIPLWTDDTTQLSALAHDLLSPFVNDQLRVERVTTWLDSQPSSMSWIIDDTGHPTRSPIQLSPTIGLLALATNSQTALSRIHSLGITPLVQTITTGSLNKTNIVVPSSSVRNQTQINQPRDISVQIDRQRSVLRATSTIPLASPPGVLVGPLLSDWTLNALSSRRSALGALPPNHQRVAGLVHRVANLDETDPRIGWRLYLECALAPSANPTIKISVGPMNSTRASWSISKSLGLLEMRTDPDITQNPDYTSVIDNDRWIITLDLPPEAISRDGFLILGLERTDGNNHTSWPRRMMPWQDEPGRFAIDITGWTGTD